MRRSAYVITTVWLFGLGLGLFLFDWLLGRLTNGSVGTPYSIYETVGGLPWAARFNGFWQELWFVQSWVLLAAPLVLSVVRDRRHAQIEVLPWVVAALTSAVGIGVALVQTFNQQFSILGSFSSMDLRTVNLAIHNGAAYYPLTYDSVDPSLQSVFFVWLQSQWAFVLSLLIGAGIVWLARRRHKRKYSTSSVR